MTYEDLLDEAYACGLTVKEKPLRGSNGRIKGSKVAIKKDIPTLAEKACTLAEELGHYYTSTGDILDQKDTRNRKQEHRARMWAYDKKIGLTGIIEAYKKGCHSQHEMAELLDVTEGYLLEALEAYRQHYGPCTSIDDYLVYFEPALGVAKML